MNMVIKGNMLLPFLYHAMLQFHVNLAINSIDIKINKRPWNSEQLLIWRITNQLIEFDFFLHAITNLIRCGNQPGFS